MTDNNPHLNGLASSLQVIERNLQDLTQNKNATKDFVEMLNNDVQAVLALWFNPLMAQVQSRIFVESLAYNFLGLSLLINEVNWTNKDNLKVLLSFFTPPEIAIQMGETSAVFTGQVSEPNYNFLRHSHWRASYVQKISQLHHTPAYGYVPDYSKVTEQISFKLDHRRELDIFKIGSEKLASDNIEKLRSKTQQFDIWEIMHNYQHSMFDTIDVIWSIRIKTDEVQPDAVNFFELLHHLTLALKLIDDQIDVKLDDWGNGSKWALLKVTIKSFLVREDVKSVLTKAFDAAEAHLARKPIAEANKAEAEVEKLYRETSILKTQEQAYKSEELDLQLKKIDVVNRVLEAEEKMLNNKMKAIQAATQISELIKQGIIKNDSTLQIEINDLLVYKSGDLIKTKMDEVANQESIQPKVGTQDEAPNQEL